MMCVTSQGWVKRAYVYVERNQILVIIIESRWGMYKIFCMFEIFL